MDKILKYKKASNIFRMILIFGTLSLGAYHIISLINSQEFSEHVMISTILFYSFIVVALIFMTIFDIKRYKLIDEVFGKVDDADKETAKGKQERSVKNDYSRDTYEKRREAAGMCLCASQYR